MFKFWTTRVQETLKELKLHLIRGKIYLKCRQACF